MSVVITIPIYREKLTITEKVSLQQLRRVLGKYPCVFVAPESLKFDYEGLENDIAVEHFPDYWFTSITSYSRLLLTESYYARFADYDYLLVYQLDAFVFEDRLKEFCELGYDYIGAPIAPYNPLWHAIGARVGNGGLSLRKVAAARWALQKWEKLPEERQQIFQDVFLRVEDFFWGWCGIQKDFKFQCAPLDVALQFSIQEEVQRCYKRIRSGTLKPFGCHGWNETNVPFWRQQIEACGYDLSGWEITGIGSKSRRCADLHTYCQKRGHIDLSRLWGALHKRKYTAMAVLLLQWLERYPAGDKTWEGLGEELQYLWRRCRQEKLEHPEYGITLEHLEQVMDEAICRTLKAGSWQEWLPWLLESLMPLIRQSDSLVARELCKTVEDIRWQEWQNSAVYAQPEPDSVKKYHIVAIAMVKNEMDIIESFVRHTLSFADELLILDHQSSDRTRSILKALQQEGLHLTVKTARWVEYAQAEMTTELMYEAITEHGADIVIPLDADEFLVGKVAGKSVREYLEELDAGILYELPWRRYIPYQPDVKSDEFLLSRPALGDMHPDIGNKCIIGTKRILQYQLKLVQGNHYLYFEHDGQKIGAEMQECTTLELAHFYWRSQEQYQTKIAVGWPNIVARYSLAALGGGGYRNYHQRIMQGETISPLEFLQQGNRIDLRPYARPQTLRYSQQTTPKPLPNLMQASVLLAQRLAEQQMLKQKVLVTTVVPYLGNIDDLVLRLQQAANQDYPWRQVLVPCIKQPDELSRLKLQEVYRTNMTDRIPWQVLDDSLGLDVFTQLENKAQGVYVQWQLPGYEMTDNFLTRMVMGIANQSLPLSIIVTDGREDYANELPYITIHPLENTQVAKGRDFWHRLLEIGKYPVGDLTGILVTREIMNACGWLRQAFLLPDATKLPFTAWKILLTACDEGLVGIITDCYAWPEKCDLPLEALVMHQLEWMTLLQLEKDNWEPADWRETIQLFCRNGQRILTKALDGGIDTTTPLWQSYQQELLQQSEYL